MYRDDTDRQHSTTNGMMRLAHLLQFSDSALPVGSFAFSNGLESAVQTNTVSDVAGLRQYLDVILNQTARMDGIALLHAHRAALRDDLDAILTADRELLCRRVGEEQQLMLCRMGRKFAELMLAISPSPMMVRWLDSIKASDTPGCYAIGQAIALAAVGADEAEAFVVHQYGIASMLLSAALRLMRVAHFDTQRIMFESLLQVEQDYRSVRELSLDEMSAFAPVFDVLVAHHTKAHVRLFMN